MVFTAKIVHKTVIDILYSYMLFDCLSDNYSVYLNFLFKLFLNIVFYLNLSV